MGVAGGEKAISLRVGWILLDREQEFRHCLIKTPAEELREAYICERRTDSGSGAEVQRGLEMLDRDVGIARPHSEGAADVPTAREARVERECAVDQRHHGADVLTE